MIVPVSWQAREDEPGCDVRVLEELGGDEAVVGRRLGVVEDVGELLEVTRAEQVGDVLDGFGREEADRLVADPEELGAAQIDLLDPVGGEQAVGRRRVLAEGGAAGCR